MLSGLIKYFIHCMVIATFAFYVPKVQMSHLDAVKVGTFAALAYYALDMFLGYLSVGAQNINLNVLVEKRENDSEADKDEPFCPSCGV